MSDSHPHPILLRGSESKRASKACNRCRIKKSKCEGPSPCRRCRKENAICVFDRRRSPCNKSYPKGYVELLESQQAQLVKGLQKLYQELHNGTASMGAPSKDSSNRPPSVHDILKSLGVLKPNGHPTDDIRLTDGHASSGSCSDSSTFRFSKPTAQDPTLFNSCIMGRHPSAPTKSYTHLATPIELSATGQFFGQTFTQFDFGDHEMVPEFRPTEYFGRSNTTPAMSPLLSDLVAWGGSVDPVAPSRCPPMEEWFDGEDDLRCITRW
ncbi:hypothetical protein, variant [Exophiala sideris]|uniref:Zn(2)-C6 fungal-type domain-containing protein n=1 Tax=Exophiala sideris TaxID=1016849 RepID=A0A0D1YJS8_9EURO|nr:hypothetical protein, variant [Exophiala sideris]